MKYQWWKQEKEGRRLNKVLGVKQEAGFRDKVKHIVAQVWGTSQEKVCKEDSYIFYGKV